MVKLQKVVFLDRDGVINEESPDYVLSVKEFHFIPKSLEAIKLLSQNGFLVIVITNQSAVGRGWMSLNDLNEIHSVLIKEAEKNGGMITDIFFCPHHPSENCNCRKPLAGLIHKAMARYEIDIKSSFMVGDSAKDIECALNAGIKNHILVQTGNGIKAQKELLAKNIRPWAFTDDLYRAVKMIIRVNEKNTEHC